MYQPLIQSIHLGFYAVSSSLQFVKHGSGSTQRTLSSQGTGSCHNVRIPLQSPCLVQSRFSTTPLPSTVVVAPGQPFQFLVTSAASYLKPASPAPPASVFNHNESDILPIASYSLDLGELWDAGGMPVGAEEQWLIFQKMRSDNSAIVMRH